MRISIIIVSLCVLYKVSATSSEEDRTSFWDMIPVISQGKSMVQLIFGDTEGAKKTQENFLNEGIGCSQLRSAYFLVTGEPKIAMDIQEKFVSNLEQVIDGLPIIGHFKGGIHLLVGDDKHGWNALKSATSTTGAIVGGVFGGPVGAISGHLLTDTIITATDTFLNGNQSQPHGVVGYLVHMKNLTSGEHFDQIAGLVLDTRVAKTVKTKSDCLKIDQIVSKESEGSHDTIPLIDSESLKNKRIVGMLKESNPFEVEEADEERKETVLTNDVAVGTSELAQFKTPLRVVSNRYEETNNFKKNEFMKYTGSDLSYNQYIYNLIRAERLIDVCDETCEKYQHDYYLDKLDIDSLKNKLSYLTDAEKSLVKKNDFRSVRFGLDESNTFICTLAGIFGKNVKTVRSYLKGKSKSYDQSIEMQPRTCLDMLTERNIIKYTEPKKLNSIDEVMKYLKANAKKLENKNILFEQMDEHLTAGRFVVLRYKMVNNNADPVMLTVDYQFSGFFKTDYPNPLRFKSYINLNKHKRFYIAVIEILK